MNTKIIKNVCLYIRTSTDNHKESPKIQEEQLQEYCNRCGYEIVDKYVDFGYSGKNTKRPAFELMMQEAKEKKFDMVIVTKIDRFARSNLDLLFHVKELQDLDIEFASISQPFDTSSPSGTLMLQIMGAFAEFERSMIAERMREGREKAIANGVICHRPKKDIDSKKLIELIDKKLSATAISKYFGVAPNTITSRLDELGYVYENYKWIKFEESMEFKLKQYEEAEA
ncbi:site-specific DNA recombinase [Methanohalophilus levihalophilus]|uniref:recombinase family protein n=1 Tax=Methanohalophilus levihalophilus TaxID=1431282 RepID=UPI001AE431A4|nr:recombinase family protein [Methanohalophilus levihalophilus]MBP2030821.1 site-specific DNA recombinase [Methanohalophilus levihalophilus]